MEKFSDNKSLNSVSGLHRSLFHPLATERHRIRAGPEKEKLISNMSSKQE